MLCDICKKNEATIHIQEIIGDQKKTVNMCSHCALEKQLQMPMDIGSFNLAEMIYNLTGQQKDSPSGQIPSSIVPPPVLPTIVCPVCGMDNNELLKNGKVGCANCYSVFADLLLGAIKNMHNGIEHRGKVPSNVVAAQPVVFSKEDSLDAELDSNIDLSQILPQITIDEQINFLNQDLQKAVAEENYEQAAQLRDQINLLKSNNHSSEKE